MSLQPCPLAFSPDDARSRRELVNARLIEQCPPVHDHPTHERECWDVDCVDLLLRISVQPARHTSLRRVETNGGPCLLFKWIIRLLWHALAANG
jgi:hypothetical protein